MCDDFRYRALLSTLRSSTPFVIENSALLLHLLSTHAPSTATDIRDAALGSGILLHHFHAAIFSPLEGQRFLSRYLCSLWLSGPNDCDEKRLLKRMVPSGFLGYLKMPLLSRIEEEQLDELERDVIEENIPERHVNNEESSIVSTSTLHVGAAGTNTARLRARIAIAQATATNQQKPENFRIFFHVLTKDHSLPDLIWNQQTRRELRIALESEIQYVHRETETRGLDRMAWNHQQFKIDYPSLDNEVKVGNVYMRLWLQAGDGFIRNWDEPIRLFELLFRRFLCELDRNTKVREKCHHPCIFSAALNSRALFSLCRVVNR
jgi:DnaJ family protein C protein 13